MQASHLVLRFDTLNHTITKYNNESLLLNIQNDGKRSFSYEFEGSIFISNSPGSAFECKKDDFSTIVDSLGVELPVEHGVVYYKDKKKFSSKNFNFEFNDGYFLVKNGDQTFCLLVPDLLENIKELCYNFGNHVLYYVTFDGFVRYVDSTPLSDNFKKLYQPIHDIKNTFFLNFFLIFKNLIFFLKNYFFVSDDNQRLKNSLMKVFFDNAFYKTFFYFCSLYTAFLFFLYKKNISCENIFQAHLFIGGLSYIFSNQINFLIKKCHLLFLQNFVFLL